MSSRLDRRELLRAVAAVGSVAPFADVLQAEQSRTPANERLNLAVIGTSGRGAENLAAVSTENIVALCDVDLERAKEARAAHPKADFFRDFRKMLEKQGIDAVVISTPDHMHAIPAVMAMRMGRHVYCEKPLAHSVYETRVMRDLARQNKLVTQLGTQIHAEANYRRVVEIVQSGILGPVKRVHVWFDGRPGTGKRAKEGTPPATLDYDLWLGPAPFRPYHASHCHYNWRWWWDFGGGTLADFGCHYLDLAFWALDLHYPTTVEAKGVKDHDGDNDVPGVLRVDYQFPARGNLPPVHVTWYHGGKQAFPSLAAQCGPYAEKSGVCFVGEQGWLVADYSTHQLFPPEKFKAAAVERWIPDSVGHHQEWLQAIKTGGTTTCNFDYSGALTEAVLLGNVSYRASQQKLEWDASKLTVTNKVPQVAQLLRREYRKGWSL